MRTGSFVKTRLALQSMLKFGNGWLPPVRWDIPDGEFGALAPYWCEGHYNHRIDKVYPCGPVWDDPDSVCTYRGCGWESYTGPEPDEWEAVCPNCGGHDVFKMESGDHDLEFKTLGIRKVRLTKLTNATNAVALEEQHP